MGPIELVVFDLAGTTLEDDGAVLRCLIQAAQTHNLPGTPEELNALMGMNKREVFQLLAERRSGGDAGHPLGLPLGLPLGVPLDVPRGERKGTEADRVAEQALATFTDAMRATYDRSLRPIRGAEETFVHLRERGVKVAVDTGFDHTIVGMIMQRLDWPGRLVDVVVCSSDVPRGRPAPYMIFRAMECLDVLEVRRVMKIGDSPADLEEGLNAGCGEVIGVLSGAHSITTLGPRPHTRLLPSVADLPSLFE